jgi:phosphonopyruvate decarboxylase
VIEADAFLDPAAAAGFDFYTGVPCSFLTPVINRVIGRTDLTYVPAARAVRRYRGQLGMKR